MIKGIYRLRVIPCGSWIESWCVVVNHQAFKPKPVNRSNLLKIHDIEFH